MNITGFKNTGSSITGGGGGSPSTTTLQEAYNNSQSPEIETKQGQGLTIKSGGVNGLEQVLKIEDNFGTVNTRIDASGLIVANDLSIQNETNLRNQVSLGSIPNGFEYNLPIDNQTAENGSEMKYNSSTKTLQFYKFLNFSQFTTTSVFNSSVEELLNTTGLGSNVYTGNTGLQGSCYKLESGGFIRTNGAGQIITLRIRWGPNIVVSTGPIQLDTLPNNDNWEFNATITIRDFGSAGNSVGLSKFSYNNNINQFFCFLNTTSSPLDTSINQNINFVANWNNASLDNAIFCQYLNIRQIS